MHAVGAWRTCGCDQEVERGYVTCRSCIGKIYSLYLFSFNS